MKPKPNPELVDDENPEWTDEDFARAVEFSKLPASLREKLAGSPAVVVIDDFVQIPVAAELVARFRAAGPDCAARINAALAEWLETHEPGERR